LRADEGSSRCCESLNPNQYDAALDGAWKGILISSRSTFFVSLKHRGASAHTSLLVIRSIAVL
jgi:hypothetical protein